MRAWCRKTLTSCVDACREAVHPDTLSRHRLLAPLAPRLSHPSAWSTDPRPLAIGVSAGLLWAFLTPVFQIPLACVHATIFRGNLLVAALATLVTNPLTFAPWTYLAHSLGDAVLHLSAFSLATASTVTAATAAPTTWLASASSVGLAWFVGTIVLGVSASILGYVLTPPLALWFQRRRAAATVSDPH